MGVQYKSHHRFYVCLYFSIYKMEEPRHPTHFHKTSLSLEKFQGRLHKRNDLGGTELPSSYQKQCTERVTNMAESFPKHRKLGVHGGCNVSPHIVVGNNYFPLSHNAKQHVKWSCQLIHSNQILTKQHAGT